MNWIYKLQRRFGKYAIPNLSTYLIILYVAGYILMMTNPGLYYNYLALDPAQVMRGQIWRLVTFIIQPPTTSMFNFLLLMYMFYLLGRTLERVWGAFLFDLYIIIGILGHILGAMIVYWVTGYNGAPFFYNLAYLYMSLFFAYAATFPDAEFLLFFLMPIKAKWLALADGLLFLYTFFTSGMSTRIIVIMSLANFILFYFSIFRGGIHNQARNIARKVVFATKIKEGQRNASQARSASVSGKARHRCAVCGRTELDDPTLEFRFCSQCDGSYEYCMDHLYTHKHIKKETT